jgi:hypothetical protein
VSFVLHCVSKASASPQPVPPNQSPTSKHGFVPGWRGLDTCADARPCNVSAPNRPAELNVGQAQNDEGRSKERPCVAGTDGRSDRI